MAAIISIAEVLGFLSSLCLSVLLDFGLVPPLPCNYLFSIFFLALSKKIKTLYCVTSDIYFNDIDQHKGEAIAINLNFCSNIT